MTNPKFSLIIIHLLCPLLLSTISTLTCSTRSSSMPDCFYVHLYTIKNFVLLITYQINSFDVHVVSDIFKK